MAVTYTDYNAVDADTFIIPFSYIKKEHVLVFFNGVSVPFQFVSDSLVKLSAPVTGVVRVQRKTGIATPAIVYQGSSTLTERQMNTSVAQLLNAAQELNDGVDKAVATALNAVETAGITVRWSKSDLAFEDLQRLPIGSVVRIAKDESLDGRRVEYPVIDVGGGVRGLGGAKIIDVDPASYLGFGGSTTAVNSILHLEAYIAQCLSSGRPLDFSGGDFRFDAPSVTIQSACTIRGLGGRLWNLRFELGVDGQKSDWDVDIGDITFQAEPGRDAGLGLRACRNVVLQPTLTFRNCDKPLVGHATSITQFHSIGMLRNLGASFRECNYNLYLTSDDPTILAFNDFQWFNSLTNRVLRKLIYAEQLDGLQFNGNVVFTGRNLPLLEEIIDIRNGEQITIGGDNHFFGSGRATISLKEVGQVTIGNCRIFEAGQQVPSPGIEIVNTTKFLKLNVCRPQIIQATRGFVRIDAPAGWTGAVDVCGEIDLRATLPIGADNGQFYFGSSPVSATQNAVEVLSGGAYGRVGDCAGLLHLTDGSIQYMPVVIPQARQHVEFHVRRAGTSARTKPAVVSAPNTPVFTVLSPTKATTAASGLVTIDVRHADSDTGANIASYVLHVLIGPGGPWISVISEVGLSAENGEPGNTNWPAFDWDISVDGRLSASPRGLTSVSQVFYFAAYCTGSIVLDYA